MHAIVLVAFFAAAVSSPLDSARDRQDRPALETLASTAAADANKAPKDPDAQCRAAMAYSSLAEVAIELKDRKAGRQFAREGEVWGFEPREIHAERCEEVEIVLDNSDEIRHDLMVLGLDPMFALNVLGPNVASARFVTPDDRHFGRRRVYFGFRRLRRSRCSRREPRSAATST